MEFVFKTLQIICYQRKQVILNSAFTVHLKNSLATSIHCNLANKINWRFFEEAFAKLYTEESRPAKPIRLMVSLLCLNTFAGIGNESVVEQWSENCYYQYFGGEKVFACGGTLRGEWVSTFQKPNWRRGNRIEYKKKATYLDKVFLNSENRNFLKQISYYNFNGYY